MTARARLGICLLILVGLYAFHVSLKIKKIYAHPTWDATDDTGQFWSEFAFHYGFAKFFAEHPMSDWGQLAQDRLVQYPDVVNDWAEFTVAMEVPVGMTYRWLGMETPFHVWVVWYDCLVGSLALVAIFLLAREMWRSDLAGLAAAFFYATLYPSYGRTVKNLFLREDFAVPLILLALWLTVRMFHRGNGALGQRALPVGAALMWLAALASWHLTQFVLAVFVAAMVVAWLLTGMKDFWGANAKWFVVTLVVGSILIPVLRAKQFYLSPVICLVVGLALAQWIDGSRRKQIGVFLGTVIVLSIVSLLLRKSYDEYAHVYQLFLAKLHFLGVKPSDPSLLTWEARSLWEGAFNTAPAGEWWHSLQWCGPLAIVAIIGSRKAVGRGQKSEALAVWIVFTILLVPLSWMVVRYFTFLGFAAAVCAAGLVAVGSSVRAIIFKVVVVAALVWQFVALDSKPMERMQPSPDEYKQLVAGINLYPPDTVILAHITESPVFWAHTDRPIIMHPKFENQRIRERYREMLAAIYSTEADFHAFCRKYGAELFVYDGPSYLLAAKDSRRYKADRLEALPADCAARFFAENPDGLQHFQPELRTDRFTVFRVAP